MALIGSFREVSAERNSMHKPVECGWRRFHIDGANILQLDTYGTADREMPDKVSQTIQIARAAAEQLLGLIRSTFPDLR